MSKMVRGGCQKCGQRTTRARVCATCATIDRAEAHGDALVQEDGDGQDGEHLVECADCGETYDRGERGVDGCPECECYRYRGVEQAAMTDGGEDFDLFDLENRELRERADYDELREHIQEVIRLPSRKRCHKIHLRQPGRDRSVCEGYVNGVATVRHSIEPCTDDLLKDRICNLCLQRLLVREIVSLREPQIVTDGGRDIIDEIDLEELREEFGHLVVSKSKSGNGLHIPDGRETEKGPGAQCAKIHYQTKRQFINKVPDSHLRDRLCVKCVEKWTDTDTPARVKNCDRSPAEVLRKAGFEVVKDGHAGNDPEVVL